MLLMPRQALCIYSGSCEHCSPGLLCNMEIGYKQSRGTTITFASCVDD